jgi:L,D-transpeptidase ErfK/SrfK
MRLYPEDIEELFGMVAVNTKVTIVNQPFKLGWQDGRLWVEVHPALKEDVVEPPTQTDLTRLVVEATRQTMIPVDWSAVQRAFDESRGVPVVVSLGAQTLVSGD